MITAIFVLITKGVIRTQIRQPLAWKRLPIICKITALSLSKEIVIGIQNFKKLHKIHQFSIACCSKLVEAFVDLNQINT